MRTSLEVLNSVDHIMTTSTRDSECVSVSVHSNRVQRENQRLSMSTERESTHWLGIAPKHLHTTESSISTGRRRGGVQPGVQGRSAARSAGEKCRVGVQGRSAG